MHDHAQGWKDAFASMFDAINMEQPTASNILATMRNMPRNTNRLDDIVIAARMRNIAANDDAVLKCLRVLFKHGKILYRQSCGRDFFIVK